MVYKWIEAAQELLFPPGCLLCGAPSSSHRDLCAGCFRELPHNLHACRRCALPLPAEAAGNLCGGCQQKPPAFDHCLAPLRYAPPVDRLVTALKFGQRLVNARLLGGLLWDYTRMRADFTPDFLVPVPLHPRRLRDRGFNQALEISREVARLSGIPVRHGCVRRNRATPPQAGLGRRQRLHNLHDAFTASGSLAGMRIALVDDVVTSGQTANAVSTALFRAGAAEVSVWTVARTPG
ncbi:MAG: ComF family protein [Pseudomonadota bacterium]